MTGYSIKYLLKAKVADPVHYGPHPDNASKKLPYQDLILPLAEPI